MQITDYFSQLCQHCGVDALSVTEMDTNDQKEILIEVDPDEAGMLIGRGGETVLSLQRLARASFASQNPGKRLVVNVNDYRQQREEKLTQILRDVAQRSLDTNQSIAFPLQLTSAERFFVHSKLSKMTEFASLESVSVGEGRARRLIVQPKKVNSDE